MTTPPAPPPQSTPSPAHKTVSRGLTGTLRGFLYAAAATGLAGALAAFNEITKFNDWLDGEQRGALVRLADANEVKEGVVGLFGLTALVLAILTIIWWYQCYQAIERTNAEGRSWSAGWAIGGWFIPIANLIIPKLVLNEIDRVSAAAEEGSTEWRSRRLLNVANLWWVVFVIGAVLVAAGVNITTEQIESFGFNAEAYRLGLWLTALGLAADVPAAVFAASAVRTYGDRLNR